MGTTVFAVGNRYDPAEDTQYFGETYGQNLGVREVSQVSEDGTVTVKEGESSVKNADLDAYLASAFGADFDWDKIQQDYIKEGIYVISGSREINWDDFSDLKPGDLGDDTEAHPVEVGGRVYVHIKDAASADKYYLLVSSTKDVAVGDSLFTDGEGGYGLLDDKYVSTHMKESLQDGNKYSYLAHDLGTSGGKIGLQEAGSEGQKYIYVVCETPADYYQRLANEDAGLEDRLPGEDRPYMPANNNASTDGTWLNEWHNTKYGISFYFDNSAAEGEDPVLTLSDDYGFDVDETALAKSAQQGRDGRYSSFLSLEDLGITDFTLPVTALYRDSTVNDGVIRTGGTEGDSNTRLGGYSGENVVVAKFEVTVGTGKAQIAAAPLEEVYGDSESDGTGKVVTDYFENAKYYEDGSKEDLTITAGEPWYVHTQIADCSGRGGYINNLVQAAVKGDEGVLSYDPETGILTGLQQGSAEVTFTVEDGHIVDQNSGEDLGTGYEGTSVTLDVTVEDAAAQTESADTEAETAANGDDASSFLGQYDLSGDDILAIANVFKQTNEGNDPGLEGNDWYGTELKLARLAADMGVGEAALWVGEIYQGGHVDGVNESEAVRTAMEWWEKAVKLGQPRGWTDIGLLYAHKNIPGGGALFGDIKEDTDKSLEYLQKADEAGDTKAPRYLAQVYEAAEDYKNAAVYYKKAADLGDITANYSLGALYEEGKGVDQDYTEAVKWYTAAAQSEKVVPGVAEARYALGCLYEKGLGVDQDLETAKTWYQSAADAGNKDAAAALERLKG